MRAQTQRREPITLSKMHFLYFALILGVVLPVLAGIVATPMLSNVWCGQFEMPEYERSFGFTMGSIQIASQDGGSRSVSAFVSIRPGGLFERAGVRSGDIPRMHHGVSSLCGALAAASDGYRVNLDVVNADDARAGHYERRRQIGLPSKAQ
jgi:hypothetical protein